MNPVVWAAELTGSDFRFLMAAVDTGGLGILGKFLKKGKN